MKYSLNYDKIVIGSSLEALLFAFYNKLKIIYTRNLQPNSIEIIEDFGLGNNKKNIWDKHAFQLLLAGYIPFENKVKHIRYISKNEILIITKEDKTYNVSFNNLYVFDDYNFLDLPISSESTSSEYRIVDRFKYKSKKIDRENIQRQEKFINQIIFEDKKEILVVSFIKKIDLDKTPEHLIKIKTENILNELKLNLDHDNRQIYDLGQNVYEDFDNVCFVYTDAKLMFDFHKRWVKIDYMKYLRLKMGLL